MDPQMVLLLLAVLGGLGAGTIGYFESNEVFNPRKFVGTIYRSGISALIAFLSFGNASELTVGLCVMALLAGAGVDYTVNTAEKLVSKE